MWLALMKPSSLMKHFRIVCDTLALQGTRVIVAGSGYGLCRENHSDKCRFFCLRLNILPSCMPFACIVEILRTIPIENKTGNQLLIGEKDLYEPRCRICYMKGEAIG